MAHGDDFREEIATEGVGGEEAEELVKALRTDHRQADLSVLDRAICNFAVELTHQPSSIDERAVAAFFAAGGGDEMLHDVVQVAGLFNYYNRLAEGCGVDPEPEWAASEATLSPELGP